MKKRYRTLSVLGIIFICIVILLYLISGIAIYADDGSTNNSVVITYEIYDSAYENSGGTHPDTADRVDVITKEVNIIDNSFTAELDEDWGSFQVSTPIGIEAENTYTEDGNLKFNVDNTYTGTSNNIRIKVCKDWTSRIYQFNYIWNKETSSWEYYNTTTAIAPTKGELVDSNNYVNNELINKKGVSPISIDGYDFYYTDGNIYYQSGATTSKLDMSKYNLLYDSTTHSWLGHTPKLTGNEYFYVLLYYVETVVNPDPEPQPEPEDSIIEPPNEGDNPSTNVSTPTNTTSYVAPQTSDDNGIAIYLGLLTLSVIVLYIIINRWE